jgi:V8-like Glu-specific endopeptidase
MRRRFPDHVLGNVAGERWCTGTLIGPATVLTAGHCFDVNRGEVGWFTPSKVDAAGTATHLPPSELAKLQTVVFNYQVNGQTKLTRSGESFPIKQLIEHRKGGLDYAIVELGPNASNQMPATLGFQPAALAASLAATGKPIAIIQHPQGDPKKIEAGIVESYRGPEIYYADLDTYGGSSGSGILDQNGDIIGVHTNGGCHAIGGANKGFQIQAIKAASDVLP